jgi:TolB-like protein
MIIAVVCQFLIVTGTSFAAEAEAGHVAEDKKAEASHVNASPSPDNNSQHTVAAEHVFIPSQNNNPVQPDNQDYHSDNNNHINNNNNDNDPYTERKVDRYLEYQSIPINPTPAPVVKNDLPPGKKMNVSVVEFQTIGLDEPGSGYVVSEWLVDSLYKTKAYNLMERISLSNVINEMKLSLSGMIDEKTAAEMGHLLGLDGIIVGSVAKLGDIYTISARLIDVKTASILISGTIKTKNMDDLSDAIPDLVRKLMPPQDKVIDYRKAIPALNLLVPGIAQFQANDKTWGEGFIIAGIVGAGMVADAEFNFNNSWNLYLKASNVADAVTYYEQSSNWRNLSIAGIAVWSGAIIVSTLHALFSPEIITALAPDTSPFRMAIDRESMNFSFAARF